MDKLFNIYPTSEYAQAKIGETVDKQGIETFEVKPARENKRLGDIFHMYHSVCDYFHPVLLLIKPSSRWRRWPSYELW